MDTDIFNAVFWSFFITSVIGLLLKIGGMAYKSKCKEVSCCCIKITRDTEAEEKETEFIINNRRPTLVESKSNDDMV